MDAYDVTQLPQEQLAIFVASTTGQVEQCKDMQQASSQWCSHAKPATAWTFCHLQGNQPDNMRRFWRFLLRKSLPPDSLSQLHFAAFGLGDSGYPGYNVSE
jgi:sulfite reductase alpha subunit-like flavoprotein